MANDYGTIFVSSNIYFTPVNGATLVLNENVENAVINPAGTLATLVINMPKNPNDGQTVTVGTSQTLTTITLVPGAGHVIKNTITTLPAGNGFQYIFRRTNLTWYRLD